MRSGFSIWLNIIIGPAYDTIGRKILTTLMFLTTTIGEASVPFVTTYSPGFIIVSLMQIPNFLLELIPFVPDLILESSQGMANMLNLFLKNFAFFLGSYFLALEAHDKVLFSYANLYWIVSGLCFVTTVFVVFGMKEVIV